MTPFDLEKALAGEPVITRIGEEVTDFNYQPDVKTYPLIAAVNSITGARPVHHAFTKEGRFYITEGFQSVKDLFMAD